MLSFSSEAVRPQRTGITDPAAGASWRHSPNWGDQPQGTPRLVLLRNPVRSGRQGADAGQTGGGPWSGGVRLRTLPGSFPPRFGMGRVTLGARANR